MKVLAEPQLYRWTRDEYYKMAEFGLFEGQHVELIEGQVIKMSPQGSAHAGVISIVAKRLEAAFGSAYHARWQLPLHLGERSEPEPDVTMVVGSGQDYMNAHPTTAALVVEVADSSLAYDRTAKTSLYAKAGIAEYWIINLVDRQLEVYRQPGTTPDVPGGYGEIRILAPADVVTPLARPEAQIVVADLLPRLAAEHA